MSVRFDAVSDYLIRSADLPAADPISVSLDVYISVDRNAASAFWFILNSAGTAFTQLATDTDGTTLRLNTASGGTNIGALTVGQWHHIDYRRSGATHEVRIDGGSWVTRSENNAVTVAHMILGSNTTANFLNGRLANLKQWSAQLTDAELDQERQTIRPHRTANLYGFWPMLPGSGERARDYSGNGRAFTENGTLTDEDHPPVAWGGVSQWSTYVAAAGGTQSVTPDAIASTTTLHAPTITTGSVSVTPDAIASTTTLHSPTITTGGVSVTPDHISSTTTLHAPTLTTGAVSVTPDHIASTTTLHAPTVTSGGTIVPDHISSTTTLHSPTVTPGGVSVVPGHIASTTTLHSPSVSPGSVTVTPDAISSTVALYAPTLNLGISVGHIASTAVLHGPTVLPGAVTVTPGHIASTVTLYAPTVTGGQTVTFDYPLSVSLNSPRHAALNGPRRVVLNQGRKVDLG